MAQLSDFVGGGGLVAESTTGAAQAVDFSKSAVHKAVADTETVTFSFVNAAAVAKVDLILDWQIFSTFDIVNRDYEMNISVNTETTAPQHVIFSPDGLNMYILGSGLIYQYSLDEAWDIRLATYAGKNLDLYGTDTPAQGVFSPDGMKFFHSDDVYEGVQQYDLTTAWDVSTGSRVGQSDTTGQDTRPNGVAFKPDGTKLFVVAYNSDTVYGYDLSTPWLASSATYDGNSFSVSAEVTSTQPEGLVLTPDGLSMFVLSGSVLHKYSLSTPWNVATASYTGTSASLPSSVGDGFFFDPEGKYLFITGAGADYVYRYKVHSFPTLVFPPMESPPLPVPNDGEKIALTIATNDGGASYQVINVQEGIA